MLTEDTYYLGDIFQVQWPDMDNLYILAALPHPDKDAYLVNLYRGSYLKKPNGIRHSFGKVNKEDLLKYIPDEATIELIGRSDRRDDV